MRNEIKWTAGTGQEVKIVVLTDFGVNLQGRRKTSGRKEVSVVGTIDGEKIGPCHSIKPIDHPQIVATFGRIGLTAENHDRVQQAKEAAYAEIAEHNAALDRHVDELDKVTAEGKRIENAMRMGV